MIPKSIKICISELSSNIQFLAKYLRDFKKYSKHFALVDFYRGCYRGTILRLKILLIVYKKLPAAKYNLARSYHAIGRIDDALSIINDLMINHESQEVEFLHKKIVSPESIQAIPISLIAEMYDYQAEQHVNEIIINGHYTGHHLCISSISKHQPNAKRTLDLGVGTGICGQFARIHKLNTEFIGVDASHNMLLIAKSCTHKDEPIYQELYHDNNDEFIQNTDKKYDVILLMDCTHLCDSLQTKLQRSLQLLNPGGIICVSIRSNNSTQNVTFIPYHDVLLYSDKYIEEMIHSLDCIVLEQRREQLYNDVSCIYLCLKKEDVILA